MMLDVLLVLRALLGISLVGKLQKLLLGLRRLEKLLGVALELES